MWLIKVKGIAILESTLKAFICFLKAFVTTVVAVITYECTN